MQKKPIKNVTPGAADAAPVVAITINRTNIDPTDNARIGGALTALYHAAQDAELAILRFGAAFWWVEKMIAKARDNGGAKGEKEFSATRGTKLAIGRPEGGLKHWLREYAPDVSYGTARRYRDLAEAIAGRYRLGGPDATVRLLDAPEESLEEKERKKLAKVRKFVAEKSVRELQLELDLTPGRKDVDPATGKRIHHPIKKTKAELDAMRLAAAHHRATEAFALLSKLGDRWMALKDGDLIPAVELAAQFVKKARKWLDTPLPSRARYDAPVMLDEEAGLITGDADDGGEVKSQV